MIGQYNHEFKPRADKRCKSQQLRNYIQIFHDSTHRKHGRKKIEQLWRTDANIGNNHHRRLKYCFVFFSFRSLYILTHFQKLQSDWSTIIPRAIIMAARDRVNIRMTNFIIIKCNQKEIGILSAIKKDDQKSKRL